MADARIVALCARVCDQAERCGCGPCTHPIHPTGMNRIDTRQRFPHVAGGLVHQRAASPMDDDASRETARAGKNESETASARVTSDRWASLCTGTHAVLRACFSKARTVQDDCAAQTLRLRTRPLCYLHTNKGSSFYHAHLHKHGRKIKHNSKKNIAAIVCVATPNACIQRSTVQPRHRCCLRNCNGVHSQPHEAEQGSEAGGT